MAEEAMPAVVPVADSPSQPSEVAQAAPAAPAPEEVAAKEADLPSSGSAPAPPAAVTEGDAEKKAEVPAASSIPEPKEATQARGPSCCASPCCPDAAVACCGKPSVVSAKAEPARSTLKRNTPASLWIPIRFWENVGTVLLGAGLVLLVARLNRG
eukprot:RCo047027